MIRVRGIKLGALAIIRGSANRSSARQGQFQRLTQVINLQEIS
jgi:hypothetical protein